MSATSLGKIMDALVSNGNGVNTNNECNNNDDDEKPLTEESNENETNQTNQLIETNEDSTTEADDGIDEDSLSGQNAGEESPEPQEEEEGGFIKNNLTLNLDILTDESGVPKNKKFLESSEDQFINQIFFQTITVTPTTDEDFIDSKFMGKNIANPLTATVTSSEEDEGEQGETPLEPVDFFSKKIEEDIEDTTYTDTADNYQENDANLCSLNDNFNDNYCSFSSIDYQAQQGQGSAEKNSGSEDQVEDEDEFLLLDEHLKHQRPSIIIDCYDDDIENENSEKENSEKEISEKEISEKENSQAVIDTEDNEDGEGKINNYCFYFDQTIEEDDEENDDVVYVNGNNLNLSSEIPDDCQEEPGEEDPGVDLNCSGEEIEIQHIRIEERSESNDIEGEEKCLEINIQNDEERELEDCGVINESCVRVHVSVLLTQFFFKSPN